MAFFIGDGLSTAKDVFEVFVSNEERETPGQNEAIKRYQVGRRIIFQKIACACAIALNEKPENSALKYQIKTPNTTPTMYL